MLDPGRLKTSAPGLYVVLSVHARKVYGKQLEELGRDELMTLLTKLLPGRGRLVSAWCESKACLVD